jgi:hypothetical protein
VRAARGRRKSRRLSRLGRVWLLVVGRISNPSSGCPACSPAVGTRPGRDEDGLEIRPTRIPAVPARARPPAPVLFLGAVYHGVLAGVQAPRRGRATAATGGHCLPSRRRVRPLAESLRTGQDRPKPAKLKARAGGSPPADGLTARLAANGWRGGQSETIAAGGHRHAEPAPLAPFHLPDMLGKTEAPPGIKTSQMDRDRWGAVVPLTPGGEIIVHVRLPC